MSINPETIANDLIEQINLFRNTYPRNEFTYTKLKKQAQQLLKADSATGYCALGMLASLNNDAATATDFFEKALKIRPNDFTAFANYMISLRSQSLTNQFLECASKFRAAAVTPEQKSLANTLILSAYIDCGKFQMARQYFEECHSAADVNTKSDMKHSLDNKIQTIPQTCDFLDQQQIDPTLLTEYISIMGDIIHEHGLNFSETDFISCADEDEAYFLVDKYIHCDSNKAAEITLLLAERTAHTNKFDKLTDRVICKYIGRTNA